MLPHMMSSDLVANKRFSEPLGVADDDEQVVSRDFGVDLQLTSLMSRISPVVFFIFFIW